MFGDNGTQMQKNNNNNNHTKICTSNIAMVTTTTLLHLSYYSKKIMHKKERQCVPECGVNYFVVFHVFCCSFHFRFWLEFLSPTKEKEQNNEAAAECQQSNSTKCKCKMLIKTCVRRRAPTPYYIACHTRPAISFTFHTKDV